MNEKLLKSIHEIVSYLDWDEEKSHFEEHVGMEVNEIATDADVIAWAEAHNHTDHIFYHMCVYREHQEQLKLTTETAKAFLTEQGYYMGHLWSEDDVLYNEKAVAEELGLSQETLAASGANERQDILADAIDENDRANEAINTAIYHQVQDRFHAKRNAGEFLEPGCYSDSNRGTYNYANVVCFAIEKGFQSSFQAEYLAGKNLGDLADDEHETMMDEIDEAAAFLTKLCPDGHEFACTEHGNDWGVWEFETED